jgi:hypothetical protein
MRQENILRLLVLVLALMSVEYPGAGAGAQRSAPPRTVREVEFSYHTDVTGIDPKAHRVEAWIPLPREGRSSG